MYSKYFYSTTLTLNIGISLLTHCDDSNTPQFEAEYISEFLIAGHRR